MKWTSYRCESVYTHSSNNRPHLKCHDMIMCGVMHRATWIANDKYWELQHSRDTATFTATYLYLEYSVLPGLCKFRR